MSAVFLSFPFLQLPHYSSAQEEVKVQEQFSVEMALPRNAHVVINMPKVTTRNSLRGVQEVSEGLRDDHNLPDVVAKLIMVDYMGIDEFAAFKDLTKGPRLCRPCMKDARNVWLDGVEGDVHAAQINGSGNLVTAVHTSPPDGITDYEWDINTGKCLGHQPGVLGGIVPGPFPKRLLTPSKDGSSILINSVENKEDTVRL